MSFGYSGGDFIVFLQRVNKLRREYAAAPKECEAILSEVDNVAIILQDFKENIERYSENDHVALTEKEHFSNSMKACEAVVTDIERAVAKYVSTQTEHPTWKDRARWVGERFKWDSLEIDRLRSRLTSTLSSLSRSVDNINQKNRVRLEIRQQRQEDKEVLDWLTSTVYNVDHSMSRKRRSGNTGQWLLDSLSYQRWMRSATGDVLFLRGDPGVGKTVLTSIVVDDLKKRYDGRDMAVCFYYCNYTRTLQEQSSEMIWRAILRQLGQHSSILLPGLHNLYNTHKDSTEPDLVTIRKALYAAVSKFKRLYIIIDALDEFPSAGGHQYTLISDILELYKSSKTSIKILITSRRLPDIESRFASFKSLDIRASNEDISRYIEANIQPHYQPLYDNVKKQPNLLDEIKSAIVDAADGIFLLAQLHIDSLKRKVTIGDLRRAIKSLDKGSDGYVKAYDKTMQRISGQDEIGKIAINALMWVVYAKRALTRTELLHALATRPRETSLDADDIPEMDLVLSGCCGLLILESDTDIVRLVHRTTQEYLTSHGSKWFKAPHTQISDICLTYLAFEGIQSRSDLTEEANQQQNTTFPLIDYASWHHQHHMIEREQSLTAEELAAIPEKVATNSQLAITDTVTQYSELCLKYPGITGLHLVAYCGLTEIMPHFLDRYEINATDRFGNTPISYAVDQYQGEAVQLLLGRGAGLDFRFKSGDTLLLRAMKHEVQSHSGTEGIRLRGISSALIEAGINVNAGDYTGNTPISYAVDQHHVEAVQRLLNQGGAQLDFQYESGDTLLLRAMQQEVQGPSSTRKIELRIFRALIKAGIDVNAEDPTGSTPISYAVHRYNVEAVQLLLRNGSRLDFRYRYGGDTLLLRAMRHEVFDSSSTENAKLRISRVLLEAGIDVNAEDSLGRTPLMFAAWHYDLSFTRLLIDYNANPLHEDNKSRDVLLYTLDQRIEWVYTNDYYREDRRSDDDEIQWLVAQAIMEHPDAPSINGEQGRNYLCSAIESARRWPSKITELFFDAGVRLTSEDAQRILEHLSEVRLAESSYPFIANGEPFKLESMLEYFLDNGIPMERIVRNKLTFLDFLIICGSASLLSRALARAFKIRWHTDRLSKWSHLHWACKTGNALKILLLVMAGYRDTLAAASSLQEFWTPMDIWCDSGYSLEAPGQTLDGWIFTVDSKQGEMSVKRTSEQGFIEIEWSSKTTKNKRPQSKDRFSYWCHECFMEVGEHRGFSCHTCERKSERLSIWCGMCKDDVNDLHEGHEWRVPDHYDPLFDHISS